MGECLVGWFMFDLPMKYWRTVYKLKRWAQ
jgi:hypothetical protein